MFCPPQGELLVRLSASSPQDRFVFPQNTKPAMIISSNVTFMLKSCIYILRAPSLLT